MKALVLVDLQNDFFSGGASPVPKGDQVVAVANLLQPCFKLVVATQDWHPVNHLSYAAQHPGRKPGEVISLKGLPQLLWPVHCVRNTDGARFHSGLQLHRINKIIRKGTDPEVDSYSGFFDNKHREATELAGYLRDKRVESLYVMGLPTEYSVKFTVLDACALGFKTSVIEDGCRGYNLKEDDAEMATEEMKGAGATIVRSTQILEAWKSTGKDWQ
jgi:nicotinamidase/pyrazinamidase